MKKRVGVKMEIKCDHCYCGLTTVFSENQTGGILHKVCCNCGHKTINATLIPHPSMEGTGNDINLGTNWTTP